MTVDIKSVFFRAMYVEGAYRVTLTDRRTLVCGWIDAECEPWVYLAPCEKDFPIGTATAFAGSIVYTDHILKSGMDVRSDQIVSIERELGSDD